MVELVNTTLELLIEKRIFFGSKGGPRSGLHTKHKRYDDSALANSTLVNSTSFPRLIQHVHVSVINPILTAMLESTFPLPSNLASPLTWRTSVSPPSLVPTRESVRGVHNRSKVVYWPVTPAGLAIVRNLALQYPSSTFNDGPFLIYLTARDQTRGEEAVRALQNDAQLKKAKALASDGGLSSIKYHALDISQPKSITDFASFLKTEHPDGVDMIVNNAGIAMEGFSITPTVYLFAILADFTGRQSCGRTDTGLQLSWDSRRHPVPTSVDPLGRPSCQCLKHVRTPQLEIFCLSSFRFRIFQIRRWDHMVDGCFHVSCETRRTE